MKLHSPAAATPASRRSMLIGRCGGAWRQVHPGRVRRQPGRDGGWCDFLCAALSPRTGTGRLARMHRGERTMAKRVAALAAAIVLFAAPAFADGTLRFVPQADLRILDTTWTTAAITRNHGYLVYEPLFSFDSKGAPKPQAVQDWNTSADGLTYNFTLRPGMTFQD